MTAFIIDDTIDDPLVLAGEAGKNAANTHQMAPFPFADVFATKYLASRYSDEYLAFITAYVDRITIVRK